jgi:hypothetical protein
MGATAEELLEFLIDSARYGDTDDVKVAIQEKVAVDGQDSNGRTGKLCLEEQQQRQQRTLAAAVAAAAAAGAAA